MFRSRLFASFPDFFSTLFISLFCASSYESIWGTFLLANQRNKLFIRNCSLFILLFCIFSKDAFTLTVIFSVCDLCNYLHVFLAIFITAYENLLTNFFLWKKLNASMFISIKNKNPKYENKQRNLSSSIKCMQICNFSISSPYNLDFTK